jgi:hypothetical protein
LVQVATAYNRAHSQLLADRDASRSKYRPDTKMENWAWSNDEYHYANVLSGISFLSLQRQADVLIRAHQELAAALNAEFITPFDVNLIYQEISKSNEVDRLENDMYNALLPYWTVK